MSDTVYTALTCTAQYAPISIRNNVYLVRDLLVNIKENLAAKDRYFPQELVSTRNRARRERLLD